MPDPWRAAVALDIDRLLADVSPDEPCGDDLSYDPDYYAVFNAAQGTPPREEMAGQAVEGEEPSWPDIRRQCTDLLKRT
jgi:type VI secretion system protein ImpA